MPDENGPPSKQISRIRAVNRYSMEEAGFILYNHVSLLFLSFATSHYLLATTFGQVLQPHSMSGGEEYDPLELQIVQLDP